MNLAPRAELGNSPTIAKMTDQITDIEKLAKGISRVKVAMSLYNAAMRTQQPDPTPRQIADECELIQQSWCAAEHRRRCLGLSESRHARSAARPAHWQPPTVRVTPDVAAALEAM
jgi:hypothetical protein